MQQSLLHDSHLRIMAGRIIAQGRWPYTSSLLFTLRLVPVTDGSLATMGVDDGWRLYFSPEFVLSLEPEPLATVLLHEVLHVMQAHGPRFKTLARDRHDHAIWNYAGDATINAILDESEMPWPEVTPIRYADLAPYGVSDGDITETAFFKMVEWRDDPANADKVEWLWEVDCGSGSHAQSRPYELPRNDVNHPAVVKDQQDNVRDRVAHDVIQAAKGQGNVPSGLLRWANEILDPQVDWRRALSSAIRRGVASVAGRRDYSYLRPSRRQDAMRLAGVDLLLPAMRQPRPPRVGVVVDTSGSIGDEELKQMLGEITGIVKAVGVESGLTVIPCDAEAYPARKVRSRSEIENLDLPGGGGTDMGVGLAAFEDMKNGPDVVVVLTDGHTDWPEVTPKGFEKIIVILTDGATMSNVPSWAQTVVLEQQLTPT
jgi:predicted metal-dependent peptidase